jgi:glycosyltransferase involved in cell wall biosynthesis
MASHYFGSHNGGVEIIADELYRGLTASGQSVYWMAGDCDTPPTAIEDSRPIPLHILNFVEDRLGIPFPIPTSGAFKQIYSAVSEAEVVILHDCLYLSNIAAFFFARLRRVPTIIIQHIGLVPYKNPVSSTLMRIGNSIFARPMLKRAAQVVYYSETTRKYFDGVCFARPPVMVPNGVDVGLFKMPASAEAKLALREKFGLPLDRRVVLFVGRFVEKKGINILRQMVGQRPEYTWAFAGWGPLDPSSWNAKNVRVFSGLQGASLAPLYQACDALVLPSTGEGLPLVIQEALASGLPVICSSEVAGADNSMTQFVRGVTLSVGKAHPRSAEGFLTALDNLFAPGAEPADAPEKRRAFAVARYSWSHAVARYIEIAASLLSNCKGAPVEIAQSAQAEAHPAAVVKGAGRC